MHIVSRINGYYISTFFFKEEGYFETKAFLMKLDGKADFAQERFCERRGDEVSARSQHKQAIGLAELGQLV